MRDPRCWREVIIRGGITLVMAVVFYVYLDASPWVLAVPLIIAALVVMRWSVRPSVMDDDDCDDDDPADAAADEVA